MTNMKWQDFLTQAQLIVAAEKALWRGCDDIVAFGSGGGSTKYKRTGTGVHSRNYSVPQNISDLIDSNVANSATDPGLAAQQASTFSRIMSETPEDQPGYGPLSQIAGQDPQNYTGYSTGRCQAATTAAWMYLHSWAKDRGFMKLRAQSRRLNGAAMRWFKRKLGFRPTALMFEKEI